MRCLTETRGWIVPRQTEGICREKQRGAKDHSAHITQQLMYIEDRWSVLVTSRTSSQAGLF